MASLEDIETFHVLMFAKWIQIAPYSASEKRHVLTYDRLEILTINIEQYLPYSVRKLLTTRVRKSSNPMLVTSIPSRLLE